MTPFWLSVKLALWTTLILLPVGLLLGRLLAYSRMRGKAWIESLLLLPLVLPPTVLGYYLLLMFSPNSALGATLQSIFGIPLVFSFPGLVVASLIVNLPFAIQPVQQAFAAIPHDVREAAWVSGLSSWQTLKRIELPLAWPGLLCAAALTFAHTLGEFGVVLMVGGNIAGETRTLSIAIYDSVQAFDMRTAGMLTAGLVIFSLLALTVVRVTGFRQSYVRH
jgi:molybdate transport system permease protein